MQIFKTLSIIVAMGFTLSFSSNAIANTDGKVQRCYAKLHTCFQTGHLEDIFTVAPQSARECVSACDINMVANSNACSFDECVSRCEVAFELSAPPCE